MGFRYLSKKNSNFEILNIINKYMHRKLKKAIFQKIKIIFFVFASKISNERKKLPSKKEV